MEDNLVRTNYEFYKTLYTDRVFDCENGFYCVSNVDYGETNSFWNHRVHTDSQSISDELLRKTEEFFQERTAPSTVYIPSDKQVEPPSEYSEAFVDAWMFEKDCSWNQNTNTELITVESENQMEKFIDLFYQTHAPDLDNPYAGLSDSYGEQLRKKFKKEWTDISRTFYLIEHQDDLVGHRIIVNDGQTALLTTLGILPEKREQGIGSEAIIESVKLMKHIGVETVYLQTEKDSQNEDYFSKRGFRTEMVGNAFVNN
jgi:N-acetylglutamate synthase-like GNAT family acetyltransferase